MTTFKTGQVVYVGYYSSKKYDYCTIFYPSNDVNFDTEKKGYIKENAISGYNLSVIKTEYSITDFIKQFDTPDNRY